MPKIRDLGINVIPETMRPPEVGPGGGGGGGCQATYPTDCPTTSVPTTANWPTTTIPTTQYPCGPSLCPTTSVPTTANPNYGYTCPGTTITFQTFTCYPNYAAATPQAMPGCPGTSFTTGPQAYVRYGCPGTSVPTTSPAQYAEYGCPGTSVIQQSNNCYPQQGLSREAIEQLKQQLHRQIAWLDEYAKSVGPKTIEEIDAREKQIREELEDLARRRKEYRKE